MLQLAPIRFPRARWRTPVANVAFAHCTMTTLTYWSCYCQGHTAVGVVIEILSKRCSGCSNECSHEVLNSAMAAYAHSIRPQQLLVPIVKCEAALSAASTLYRICRLLHAVIDMYSQRLHAAGSRQALATRHNHNIDDWRVSCSKQKRGPRETAFHEACPEVLINWGLVGKPASWGWPGRDKHGNQPVCYN